MVKKLRHKIGVIFEQLKIRNPTKEEAFVVFPKEEIDHLINSSSSLNSIISILKESAFKHSYLLPYAILFKNSLKNNYLQFDLIENLKSNEYNFLGDLLSIILEIDAIKIKALNIEKELPRIMLSNKIKQEEIYLDAIISSHIDYLILNEVTSKLKNVDPKLLNEISYLKSELLSILQNAEIFWEADSSGELLFKKSILKIGAKDSKPFYVTDGILEAIYLSFQPLRDLDNQVFEKTITPKVIKDIAELIEILGKFEKRNLRNFLLGNLINSFKDDAGISERKKYLFLHDVLLLYGHPEVYTEAEENSLLGKHENFTLLSLEQAKIRRVESLLGLK